MDNIVNSIEEDIVNLYKNRHNDYNKTLKNYINLFNKIINIDFLANMKYKEIDFETIINNELTNIIYPDNIYYKFHTLNFYNDELDLKLNIVSEIVNTCNDYSKLKKEDKKIIKDTYKLARSIQIICTTDFIDHFIDNYCSMNLNIENELKSNFMLSCKFYINNLFKKYCRSIK